MRLQEMMAERPTIQKLLDENQRSKAQLSHLKIENQWLKDQLAKAVHQDDNPKETKRG